MDAVKIGKRITELRKDKGMTQKELAAKLHVTDGAVSKWERGINFPDVSLLEPLATALDTNIIELLSLERASNQEVASVLSDISTNEKKRLVKELKQRAYLNIVIELILSICMLTASILFRENQIYGLAHGVTIGALGFVGTLIGSEIFMLRNISKI